jgi:uncharacterized protein YjiS (DUF1127 family)
MNQIMHSDMSRAAHTHGRPQSEAQARGAVAAAFDRMFLWVERYRQRRTLEALPDHLLSDIGLSRYDAAHEAEKPFWRG